MVCLRLVSILCSLAGLAVAHNEVVPPRGKVCYYEHLKPQDEFSVDFQVGTRDASSSEQLEIDYYVLAPNGRYAFEQRNVANGNSKIPVDSSGRYEICFSNERSGNAAKDITFHINHVWGSELRSEQYDTLDGQLKLLKRIVEEVSHESEYLRIRERTHRNTAESTNERVKWWSMLQLLFVCANAVFQVAYLKRFFEVKSNV